MYPPRPLPALLLQKEKEEMWTEIEDVLENWDGAVNKRVDTAVEEGCHW